MSGSSTIFAVIAWGAAGFGALVAAGGLAWTGSQQAEVARLQGEATRVEASVADRLEAAKAARQALEAENARLEGEVAQPEAGPTGPYIVVCVADRALVLTERAKTTFAAKAGVGKGQEILDGELYTFDTPAGLYHISAKEETPVWLAPDWHYLELAKKLSVDTVALTRSHPVSLKDGSQVRMVGTSAARCQGEVCTPYAAGEVIVVDNKMVVPPGDSIQRQYLGVLGTRRLKLGGAYAIHGTDKPGSVGRASSHGCIRLRNEDVERLYDMVNVGTPVLIY